MINKEESITSRLVDQVWQAYKNPLPASVLEAGAIAVLDAFSCGIAGLQTAEIAKLKRGITLLSDSKEEVGYSDQALIGGSAVHALELDDTHSLSSVHGGGPVLGALLPTVAFLASKGTNIGYTKFLQALIAGYELACRVGAACRGQDPYQRGFHPTGVYGVLGSTTAVGLLIGLDQLQLAKALGIAGSFASGLMSYLTGGGYTKKIHPGWAAKSGLSAAFLSQAGFEGPSVVLDGKYNFADAHSGLVNWEKALGDLGAIYEVERMSYKAFGCCRAIHASLTVALDLVEKRGKVFDVDEIEAVEITIPDEDLYLVCEPRLAKINPTTPEQAQFSIYWGVSAALLKGQVFLKEFGNEALEEEKIRKLAGKINYRTDDEMTKLRPQFFPAALQLKLKNQPTIEGYVKAPKGDAENKMSAAELIDKSKKLLKIGQVDQGLKLASNLLKIEQDDNINNILEIWQRQINNLC